MIDVWIVANVVWRALRRRVARPGVRAAVDVMGDSREARGGIATGLSAVTWERRAGARTEATASSSDDVDGVVPHRLRPRPGQPHLRPPAPATRPEDGERAGRIPTGPFTTRG
ncbi:hypothetical protein [Curtobacterium sp. BRB10]|uniref:hypothetical protein n=1 Tax=Curtobacterium sp. BRB10 TaxID=2962579 RepID=UPI0028823462|nr:hypothetical protein [Curtobacterium sp. BRB10]MDT0232427.1 hypothetical protein [Curtobacterium sp. BRB10]